MDQEDLKDMILQLFYRNPNTSPKVYINNAAQHSENLMGLTAATMCIMREGDKSLKVTGQDENGVLLSVDEDVVNIEELKLKWENESNG